MRTASRLVLFVLLAAVATGCASTRVPDPPPPTLAEVNLALAGHPARVTLTDGTQIDGGTVEVGPRETLVVVGGRDEVLDEASRQAAAGDRVVVLDGVTTLVRGGRDQRIPTETVASVSLDASATPNQGALAGGLLGALPGAILLTESIVTAERCTGFLCIDDVVIEIPVYTAATLVGAAVGAFAGRSVARGTRYRAVYEAPITRYPDAALALMDAHGRPSSVPSDAPPAALPEPED